MALTKQPFRRFLSARRAHCLDGRHLWLTLDSRHEGVLVATSANGTEHDLTTAVVQGTQTLVVDLTQLPDTADETYSIHVRTDRRSAAIRVAPGPELPTRDPVPHDATRTFEVVETDRFLGIRVSARTPTAPVLWLGHHEERIAVKWPAHAGAELHVLSEGGVDTSFAAEVTEGCALASIATDDLTLVSGQEIELAVGTPEVPIALTRRANVLERPTISVLLPSAPTADGRVFEFLWAREGHLLVRLRERA